FIPAHCNRDFSPSGTGAYVTNSKLREARCPGSVEIRRFQWKPFRRQALPRPALASSSPFVTVGNQTPVLFRPPFLTASLQPTRPGRCHGNAKQHGYENVGSTQS